MMRTSPMLATDLAELVPQPEQAGPADVSIARARQLADAGPCYSIRMDSAPGSAGLLIFTGGFIELGMGVALAWARIAPICRRDMALVTRIVRGVIEASDYRRTVMYVRTGFAGGHRWARHLGFSREGTLREHEPGVDYDVYARLRATRGEG